MPTKLQFECTRTVSERPAREETDVHGQPVKPPDVFELFFPIAHIPFGKVCVQPNCTCVLWQGELPFDNLLKSEAFHCTDIFARIYGSDGRSTNQQVMDVTLITRGESSDDMNGYRLEAGSHNEAYGAAIQHAEQTIFARYNWGVVDADPNWSVLAENPDLVEEPNFTVVIPRRYAFPAPLAQWVLRHHPRGRAIPDVDEASLADMLSDSVNRFL